MENIETLLAAVAQTQGFDDDEPIDSKASPLGLRNSAFSPEIRVERGAPQLNGAPNEVSKEARPPMAAYPPPPAVVAAIGSVEKRKRGRPPKAKLAAPPPKKMKQEDYAEDVCFICFDGGTLVICDRKGCPKAYHPACVKRDEAFFNSKAKWNCGWHICTVCQKTSHYNCYSCTYSLCKTCIKDADYLCVRGNKGFCPTCMKTIMLIENKDQANNGSVQVDFDDKASWEYLFKVYWVYLKEQLSLTLSELNQAKNLGRGAAMACKPQSINAHQTAINGKVSISHPSSEPLELNNPQKEIKFPQKSEGASGIDKHEETLNSATKEHVPSYKKDAERPSLGISTVKTAIDKGTDEPGVEKATEKPCIEKDGDNPRVVDDTDKPCICRTRDKLRNKDPEKLETGDSTERASSSGKEEVSLQAQIIIIEKTDANGSLNLEKDINQNNVANSAIGGGNDQAMQRSGLETSTATATASVGNSPTANSIETEKLWHYRDLNGTILGPFSLLLLQKWSTTGLLPTDMRIWKNHEKYDSVSLADALGRQFHGASELPCNASSDSLEHGATGGIEGSEDINGTDRYAKQTEPACSKRASDLSDSNTGFVRIENSCSSTWPQCWDLLKDSNTGTDDVQMHNVLPSSSLGPTHVAPFDRGQESSELNHGAQNGENNSSRLTQNQISNGDELQNQPNNQGQALPSSKGNLKSLHIDLSSHDIQPESVFSLATSSADAIQHDTNGDILDLHNPTAKTSNKHWRVQTAEEQRSVSSDVPMPTSGFLELLSLTPRSSNEDQAAQKKQSSLLDLSMQNAGPSWSAAANLLMGAQLPEAADEWCGYSLKPAKPPVQEWDCGLVSASSPRPPEVVIEDLAISNSNNNQLTHASPSHPAANIPNWLTLINEPIEFDALGEESVSDLLAEVDAMESQGGLPSPTSAVKFAKEFIQYCKDDCFSSIEGFSPTHGPGKSDALSSTGEVRLTSQPALPCKQDEAAPIDTLDFFKMSSVHSSASSEGESSAPVYSSEAGTEFHPPAPNNTNREIVGANMVPGVGSEPMDPGCGSVQGNINLVTVQGNVNLVLGGPAQGMANLGWGTNAGAAWANQNINCSPINGNLPWDGQRKYGGERFASPRERSYQGNETGFLRGRPPWGRQPYGGGGYSRPSPKGQRVCKFYESGRCKKGAFCDYLHPS